MYYTSDMLKLFKKIPKVGFEMSGNMIAQKPAIFVFFGLYIVAKRRIRPVTASPGDELCKNV